MNETLQQFITTYWQGIILATAIIFLWRSGIDSQAANAPPHIHSYIPILGHTWKLRMHARTFLKECQEKYGNVFSINYLGKKIYVFSSEEAIKLIKYNDQGMHEARNDIYFLVDALGDWEGAAGKPKVWFSGEKITNVYFNPLIKRIINEVIERASRGVLEKLDCSDSIEMTLQEFCSEMVVTSVASVFVGPELAKDPEFIKILMDYYAALKKILTFAFMWLMVPKIGSSIAHRIVRAYSPSIYTRKAILRKILPILEARRQLGRESIKSRSPGQSISEIMIDDGHQPDTIADGIVLLTFLSIFTTTGACQRAISDLLGQPRHFKLLRKEQLTLGKSATVDRCQVDKMPYLDSAIRESLRHRGQRPEMWRKAVNDIELDNGMVIPKGSTLAVNMTSMHFTSEDLNEYKPFRYVGTGVSASRLTPDFFMFGAGKHACPGRVFAVQLITAILATVLRNYTITTKDHSLPPFNIHEDQFPDMEIVFTKLPPITSIP